MNESEADLLIDLAQKLITVERTCLTRSQRVMDDIQAFPRELWKHTVMSLRWLVSRPEKFHKTIHFVSVHLLINCLVALLLYCLINADPLVICSFTWLSMAFVSLWIHVSLFLTNYRDLAKRMVKTESLFKDAKRLKMDIFSSEFINAVFVEMLTGVLRRNGRVVLDKNNQFIGITFMKPDKTEFVSRKMSDKEIKEFATKLVKSQL